MTYQYGEVWQDPDGKWWVHGPDDDNHGGPYENKADAVAFAGTGGAAAKRPGANSVSYSRAGAWTTDNKQEG